MTGIYAATVRVRRGLQTVLDTPTFYLIGNPLFGAMYADKAHVESVVKAMFEPLTLIGDKVSIGVTEVKA